ncbi:uncharacterized protein LOC125381082 [Haliotis rufescens]|uniref:uncharacterized protein LOC125381082 n=1 Tax=Haliotis rufescens TaxID=6454 RepID=UPI00201F6F18|nr:uncharacterized protein LOC125381082 [Haliotis rufescens]
MQPTKTVTFLHTASLRNISDLKQFYDNNTQVVLRHRWVDGRQYDSILEQIQSLTAIPLTITSPQPDGYPKPINTVLGEYIYLCFQPNVFPKSINGFRANGQDFKFSNSDMSRNSYFAFYPNIAKRQSSSSMNFTDGLIDVMGWIKSSRKVRDSVLLSKDYFYVTEIHFGGNGGLTTSTLWSSVTGTSLGLIQAL